MYLLNSKEVKNFIEKNIHKIPVSIPSRPLNKNNVQRWIEKNKAEYNFNEKEIEVLTSIQHISYEEFLKQINKIALELKSLYLAGIKLYLLFEGDIRKSNFFVSILISYILLLENVDLNFLLKSDRFQYRTHPLITSDKFFSLKEEITIFPENHRIIVCDDCSYSGTQLFGRIIHNIDLTKKKLFIAIPYMSNKFNSMISIQHHLDLIQFSKFTILIQPTNISSISNKYLLYFDFKVPDDAAVPSMCLLYGRTIFSYSGKYNDGLTSFKNEFSLIEGDSCIIPFYKKIEWEKYFFNK